MSGRGIEPLAVRSCRTKPLLRVFSRHSWNLLVPCLSGLTWLSNLIKKTVLLGWGTSPVTCGDHRNVQLEETQTKVPSKLAFPIQVQGRRLELTRPSSFLHGGKGTHQSRQHVTHMLSFFAQQPRITRTFKMLKRILQASTAATDSRQQHADNILLSCLAQEKKIKLRC